MRKHTASDNPFFIALFLVSAASIGFEIQMTRYFAIASWSEYGYWVISIAMVGYSASGVVLSLFKDALLQRARKLLYFLALGLMAWSWLGFYLACLNPFNPLELQNRDLWWDQFLNIWKYYAALFPFFFLAGSFVGLSFLSRSREIPKVYGFDLAGAGAGAVAVLLLMFWVHPFYLGAVLLAFLAAAAALALKDSGLNRAVGTAALLVVLACGETGTLFFNRADYCEFKAITPALNVEGCQEVGRVRSPRGDYRVLDNFTERLDIDLSNNYELLRAGGPPEAWGVYMDGNRIGALPKKSSLDDSYIRASLDHFVYELKPQANVLLVGTRGGFKIREVLYSGASAVTALEPEPVIYGLMQGPFREFQGPGLGDARTLFLQASPEPYLASHDNFFGVIDLSSELLDQGDINKYHFTREALQQYWESLDPGGVLSLPASIREFTVYALKLMETSREALAREGVADPRDHLVLYRSAWNARLLVSRLPWSPENLKKLKAFCSARSFDISYCPGPVSKEEDDEVFNELPAAPFDDEDAPDAEAPEVKDSLRQDCRQLLSGQGEAFKRDNFFNLRASTQDRPSFYSVLRLSKLGKILANISQVPKEEIGYLINLAVLVQSLVFAALVLGLPLLRRKHTAPARAPLAAVFYFCCLGLGYLFVEIALIEKASCLLGDRSTAFALVLSGMLVFSGIGAWASSQFESQPWLGLEMAMVLVLIWLLAAWLAGDWALASCSGWPTGLKILLLFLLAAPVSFALGFPFSLGLGAWGGEKPGFLPWAWAINGAFSVLATPLANLVGVLSGVSRLWLLSLLLYLLAYGMFSITFRPRGISA